MNTPFPAPQPVTPAPDQPGKSRKGWYIAGGVGAAVLLLGIGGAIGSSTEDSAPDVETTEAPAPETTEDTRVTAPPVTEAPATTQAPTTTQAPPPPPPPVDNRPDIGDMSQEDFVEQLWFETGYCYTDCSRVRTPDEWLTAAEGYGLYSPADVLEVHDFLLTQPVYEVDTFCDGFWVMPDSEVADVATQSGVAPGALVVASYVWCDS